MSFVNCYSDCLYFQAKMFGQYIQFNASKLQKGGGSGLGLWISRGEGVVVRVEIMFFALPMDPLAFLVA